MKNFLNLLVLFIFVTTANAATISDNTLNLGNGTTTGNKAIKFDTGAGASNKKLEVDAATGALSTNSNSLSIGDGTASDKSIILNRGGSNATIKWDETNLKLKFAKDGVTFKDFGSGSGSGGDGGTNLLLNPSFEDAVGGVIADWTVSGGTLSQVANTNPAEGDASFGRFVATTSGQYIDSAVMTVPSTFINGCYANISFKDGDSAFKIQVIDGSANVLKEYTVGDVTAWQPVGQTFPCPTTGNTFKIRVISTAAGTIDLNKGYGGDENRTFKVAQAQHFGSARTPGTALCSWSQASGTTVPNGGTAFAADTDCPVPTVTGNITAPATRIPGFSGTFPKGRYLVRYTGGFYDSGANGTTVGFALTDGTNTYNTQFAYTNAAAPYHPVLNFAFDITDANPTAKTFNLKCVNYNVGSDTCVADHLSLNGGMEIDVYYFPTTEQVAMTAEAASYRAAATISSATAGTITFTANTNDQQIGAADLSLVNDSSASPVEIACASTASTGATCSGSNEVLGITANLPVAGVYRVCNSTSFYSSSNGLLSVRLAKVTEGTTTKLEDGRTAFFMNDQGTGDTNYYTPRICDYFTVANAGRHSFKAFANTGVGGTTSTTLSAVGDSSQRPSRWEIELVNHYVSKPILVSNEVSNSYLRANPGGSATAEGCLINNDTGTPSVNNNGGMCDWIQSVSFVSTGVVTINFVTGVFAMPPMCTFTRSGVDSGVSVVTNLLNSSTWSKDTLTTYTNAGQTTGRVNGSFIIHCLGRR